MRVPDAHLGAGKGDAKVEAGKANQMLPVLAKVCRTVEMPGSH